MYPRSFSAIPMYAELPIVPTKPNLIMELLTDFCWFVPSMPIARRTTVMCTKS